VTAKPKKEPAGSARRTSGASPDVDHGECLGCLKKDVDLRRVKLAGGGHMWRCADCAESHVNETTVHINRGRVVKPKRAEPVVTRVMKTPAKKAPAKKAPAKKTPQKPAAKRGGKRR
jgi:hypothetical protein